MYKYITILPIPEPYNQMICAIMDAISSKTFTKPPYVKLKPHITLHRPIKHIDEKSMRTLVKDISQQTRQCKVTVSNLFPFGKEFIVLPVYTTMQTATLWVGITTLLAKLPGYSRGVYDHDNTLHISVAEKISNVFSVAWPAIDKFIETMTFDITTIELHRKPIEGGTWERIEKCKLLS